MRRRSWPGKAPRKGTKNRRLIIKCLHGIKSKDLRKEIPMDQLGCWKETMLNEKGYELRLVKGVYLLAGFYRRNGRYRETPGFPARVEKILLSKLIL